MKKSLFIILSLVCVVVFGAPRSKILGSSLYKFNVTTNELGQITKYLNSGTNKIIFVYNDIEVPFKYRAKWELMTEEERSFALSTEAFKSNKFNNPSVRAIPNIKDEPKSSTDTRITSEVKVIRLRPIQ